MMQNLRALEDSFAEHRNRSEIKFLANAAYCHSREGGIEVPFFCLDPLLMREVGWTGLTSCRVC